MCRRDGSSPERRRTLQQEQKSCVSRDDNYERDRILVFCEFIGTNFIVKILSARA